MKIEFRAPKELAPFPKNARTHSEGQVAQIAASIKEFGFTNPILIDEQNGIIAGHGRLLAAKQLKFDKVPTITLKGLTDAQKRAYVIADNKLALNAGWDEETLRAELEALGAEHFDLGLIGFDDTELAYLLADRTEGLTDPDEAPEAPANPVSVLGDVWVLGNHRLVCGDCTTVESVDACLAGVKPHLIVTDPPYGVKLDPAWRDRAGINTMGKAGAGGAQYMRSGADDIEARWDQTWALTPCDVFYVWCASGRIVEVHAALTDAGFDVRQHLVWDKEMLTRTRTHYWYSHEMCLYGVRAGKTAHWIGKAGQSSVWRIPSPKHIMSGSKEGNQPHPAQKPVECMKRPIENNSSPGQAVYDPFLGSGTTLIAAEMTGRICHAIELNPAYVDVSIQRWQNFTGKQAYLASTNHTFEQVSAERQTKVA